MNEADSRLPSIPSSWPLWAQYLLAVGVVLVALGVRWVLNPLLGVGAAPFLTVFAALLVLVLLVRPGPFLVATAVGGLGALVLFVGTPFTLEVGSASESLQLMLLGMASLAAATAAWLARRVQVRRAQAEAELARRSDEIRLVADAMPALISYVGADRRYRFVNARYVEWFGRPAEEIEGRSLREVLGEHAYERAGPHAEAALAGRRSRYEAELSYRYGGTRHVIAEYVPHVRADGVVDGFFALVTDVTEQKRAEAAQARLAAIVETSGDAITSISLDGTFLTWNAGAERLFGYEPAEAIGKRLELVVPAERSAEEREILERVTAGEVVGPYDTVRRSKDGRSVEVSVTVSPIRDASGEVVGASKVDRDIAGRLASERALRDSEQELREADRRKDEFLATLAHELRNPLAAVNSATELLVSASALTPEQLDHTAGTVQRQVATMVRLVDDLLDMSRISRGALELRPARVTLMPIVEEAVASARPWIEARRQTVEVSGPSGPLEIQGDSVRLVQVLLNLLSNACDYTDPGGRIEVRVGQEEGDAIVAVRDTGVGIAPEKLDSVFEMFIRLQSPGRGQAGLGIGLTLSRQLVQMHGGTLRAASDGPGSGSTFTVRLPLAGSRREPPRPEPSRDRDGERPKGSRRVLVVDDNADAADMLAILLTAHGHVVRTAYDGRGALAEVAAFAPDAILLDLGLPDVNGVEVCRTVRAEPGGEELLVVAVSGWGQEEDKRRTAEAGFDAHLTKPARIEEVTRVLDNAKGRAPRA